MTDKQQSEVRATAAALEALDMDGVADLVRRQYAELETMRAKLKTHEDLGDAGSDMQLLRMGYAAARLEIESLRKDRADELAVAYMCGASREKELAAQQTGAAYAALPEPDATTVGLGAVWNRHSMRDFADATHALRATNGQAPAGDWLWVKLMGFCKKRGYAPAEYNDLFEIVKEARASHGQSPAQDANEYLDLLAQCRSAFPIPERGDPLEVHWAAAMADPGEVPGYLQEIAARHAAQADPADIIAGALQISRGHAYDLMRGAVEQAAPAAVAGPSEAVAYLDIGAGGYLDLGTDLTDEALSRLPKGRHALVIAGTYGIDGYIATPTTQPAPPQEAQEPAAVVVPCHTPSGKRVALYSAKQDLPIGTQLYTAPQPSPAAQGDALDDARYRLVRRGQHWSVIDGIGNALRAEELDAAVDAARAAQEGK